MSVWRAGGKTLLSARAALAILVTALGSALLGGENPLPGAWLDAQTRPNWNALGSAVPKAAAVEGGPLADGPCAEQILPPTGREDRTVADAGWSVVSEPQTRGDLVVVTAATSADGMCRPLGLQGFVFVEGKFAGTLSPHPMDSRTDGILGRVQLFESTLRADFRRYAATDPLCCPSRTSTVAYKLENGPAGALLVPGGVETVRNPPTRK
jgi:LppP/LprE lipoprotein